MFFPKIEVIFGENARKWAPRQLWKPFVFKAFLVFFPKKTIFIFVFVRFLADLLAKMGVFAGIAELLFSAKENVGFWRACDSGIRIL